jgi:hypothetical protein
MTTRFRFAGLAALGLSAIVAGQADARAGDTVADFKDWAVVCDNLRNCVADGFGANDAERPAILELKRGGASSDAVGAEIVLLTLDDGDALAGKRLVVAVDGRPVATATADDNGLVALSAAQVGPLLAAARNGAALTVSLGDKEVGVVSLAGMVAALRLVDDRQARVGTVTALVAKGPKPASAVPPAPLAPVVRAAPAVAQTGLPAKPPASVKALMAKTECDTDQTFAADAPEAHRLSANQVMWQVPCWSGAYNYSSLFVIVDNKGAGARIAPLQGVDDGTAVNANYDHQTRILSAYDKGRGVGDCGGSNEWAWTGQAFILIHAASMPICRGQADWPTSYQAKVE